MSNPWDVVNAINQHDTKYELEDYQPFLVNRSLSYFPDTIQLAQTMNLNSSASDEMQYQFLLNTVRPRKRFSKWAKKADVPELEIIATHFKVNMSRAKEIMQILPKHTIEKIITKESEKHG